MASPTRPKQTINSSVSIASLQLACFSPYLQICNLLAMVNVFLFLLSNGGLVIGRITSLFANVKLLIVPILIGKKNCQQKCIKKTFAILSASSVSPNLMIHQQKSGPSEIGANPYILIFWPPANSVYHRW